jgi:hypothetical protein
LLISGSYYRILWLCSAVWQRDVWVYVQLVFSAGVRFSHHKL